jgi:hypothetical protein
VNDDGQAVADRWAIHDVTMQYPGPVAIRPGEFPMFRPGPSDRKRPNYRVD